MEHQTVYNGENNLQICVYSSNWGIDYSSNVQKSKELKNITNKQLVWQGTWQLNHWNDFLANDKLIIFPTVV